MLALQERAVNRGNRGLDGQELAAEAAQLTGARPMTGYGRLERMSKR